MLQVNKQLLLQVLLERLTQELATARGQAMDAALGATHEDNRAEGDKDMRATEAAYIARGHAERTAKLDHALKVLSHLPLADCSSAAAKIQASAVVELEHNGQRSLYFLLPAAGGEQLVSAGKAVQTLTPVSPLGRALLGLRLGDTAEVETPQGVRSYEVTGLC